jgi:hypothetical protein
MQALNLAEADALLAGRGALAALGRGEPGEPPEPQAAASTATRTSAVALLIGPRTVSPPAAAAP